MNTKFDDKNNLTNNIPTFEFANEFENNDEKVSLVNEFENNDEKVSLVNEFNIPNDKSFDLSSIINSDDNPIKDYDKDYMILNDDSQDNENPNSGIGLQYNGISGNMNDDKKQDEEHKDFDMSILNKNIELLNKLNEESNYFDFMNSNKQDTNLNDTTFSNDDVLFNNALFETIKDDSALLNKENDDNLANSNEFNGLNSVIEECPIKEVNSDVNVENNNIVQDDKKIEKEAIYKALDDKINELDANTNFSSDQSTNITTDINNLFMKVNSNVQEASDIFTRNVEMKKIIDNRFEELKQLQTEIEESRKANYEEINNYKEEVLAKLTSKKEEIEGKLELLKNLQSEFEKEKNEFEVYKKDEIVKIETMRKEEEEAFDNRKVELNRLEEKLRKQKDFLEEEKRQLSLDQIQYETDKNELANNMIKFNEIVGKFTSGISGIN